MGKTQKHSDEESKKTKTNCQLPPCKQRLTTYNSAYPVCPRGNDPQTTTAVPTAFPHVLATQFMTGSRGGSEIKDYLP